MRFVDSGRGAVDASIKQDLLRGVEQIRSTRDRNELDAKLAGILFVARGHRARARSGRESSPFRGSS
jgi:hypothetical protein